MVGALTALREQTYGQLVFATVAIGLLAFGVFGLIEAGLGASARSNDWQTPIATERAAADRHTRLHDGWSYNHRGSEVGPMMRRAIGTSAMAVPTEQAIQRLPGG